MILKVVLLLILTVPAFAQSFSPSDLLLKEARNNDVQMERTKKYLELIEDVRRAESSQKGKSVLNDDSIVAIFHKYGQSGIESMIMNGILVEYSKQVRSGKAADQQTLEASAEKYIRSRMPLVSTATIESKKAEVRGVMASGNNRLTASVQSVH